MIRYAVVIESGDDGYTVYIPDIPGCIGEGESEAKAIQALRSELKLLLEELESEGEPPPPGRCSVRYIEFGKSQESEVNLTGDSLLLSVIGDLSVALLPIESRFVYELRKVQIRTIREVVRELNRACYRSSTLRRDRMVIERGLQQFLRTCNEYGTNELQRLVGSPSRLILARNPESPNGYSFLLIEEAIADRAITLLELRPRSQNALARHGVTTIGQLLDLRLGGYHGIRGFGVTSMADVDAVLTGIFERLQAGLTPAFEEMGQETEQDPLSLAGLADRPADEDIEHLSIGALFLAVARFLLTQSGRNSRLWPVFEACYGLNGESRTLEEISRSYDVTRERIRQIKMDADRTIRDLLFGAEAANGFDRFPPSVLRLLEAIGSIRSLSLIATEEQIDQAIGEDSMSAMDRASLHALLLIYGARPMTRAERTLLGRTDQVTWVLDPDFQSVLFEQIVRALRKRITGTESVSFEELNQHLLNRGKRNGWQGTPETITTYVKAILPLMPRVRSAADGKGFVRASHRVTMGDHIRNVLNEAGEPLHYREISRRVQACISRRGESDRISQPQISSILVTDPRFAPIGRSGRWKLSSWTEIAGGTIPELMREVLHRSSHPLRPDEIFDHVRDLRADISSSSIYMHLRGKSDWFEKQEDGTYVAVEGK